MPTPNQIRRERYRKAVAEYWQCLENPKTWTSNRANASTDFHALIKAARRDEARVFYDMGSLESTQEAVKTVQSLITPPTKVATSSKQKTQRVKLSTTKTQPLNPRLAALQARKKRNMRAGKRLH
jgi:hypothetical protein